MTTSDDLRTFFCDSDPGYSVVMGAADALDAKDRRIAELESILKDTYDFADKRIAKLETRIIDFEKGITELRAQLAVERMRP